MSLSGVQRKFTRDIADLVIYAYEELGYELTYGDAYRSPRVHGDQGERGAATYGRTWSAHKQRLAVDFNLFIDGEYQQSTAAFAELGEYWLTLDPDNVWGGDFDDGNHFSRRYNGIA
jgi:hypothetical protein